MPLAPDATSSAPADARPCLGCGYDLRGLGDEPRCPECGLLNVPQGYREEVWKLVDSGKWFFSGFFHPFKKRLPGWWWSLDRPGDVARSWKFVAINIFISGCILWIACVPRAMFKEEIVWRGVCYDQTDTSTAPIARTCDHNWIGDLGQWETDRQHNWINLGIGGVIQQRITYRPSTPKFSVVLIPFFSIVAVWMFPATVGIFTQVRKGLPSFSRPKRTFIAAANYESHRLIYSASLFALSIGLWTWLQIDQFFVRNYQWNEGYPLLVATVVGFYAAIGWVGPLRSDYTRQLVRSRSHAFRIVTMYALILPVFAMFVASTVIGAAQAR